jgi:hypothetical protein
MPKQLGAATRLPPPSRAADASSSTAFFSPETVLDLEQASRASPVSHMGTLQRHAWARAFATLEAGGTVSLVMIGGSMARGQGCSEDDSMLVSCSYSGRVAAWLRQAYPRARLLYENRAAGGMTTGGALLWLPSMAEPVRAEEDDDDTDHDETQREDRLGDERAGGSAAAVESPQVAGVNSSCCNRAAQASIILIDYSINDAFEGQVMNSKLSLDAYRSAKSVLKPLNKTQAVYYQVGASSESLLRYLLGGARIRSALLMIEGSCWRSARNTSGAHAHVARYYGVPFFDFASTLRQGIVPVHESYLSGIHSTPAGGGGGARRQPNPASCNACNRAKRGCEGSPTPVIFSEGKHPDYRGHIYVASAVRSLLRAWAIDPLLHGHDRGARARTRARTGDSAGAGWPPRLGRAAAAARSDESSLLPAPVSPPALLAQFALCSHPISVYSSAAWWKRLGRRRGGGLATARIHRNSSSLQRSAWRSRDGEGNVTVTRGSWSLDEDRKGKPGWISTGPNGSTIEFTVRFGKTPRLTFMYVQGYEGFGRVAIGFAPVGSRDSNGKTKIIDALRTDGFNVTQAATINLDVGHMNHGSRLDLAGGVAGWAIRPFAEERFRVELLCGKNVSMPAPCGKFKILGMRAC